MKYQVLFSLKNYSRLSSAAVVMPYGFTLIAWAKMLILFILPTMDYGSDNVSGSQSAQECVFLDK